MRASRAKTAIVLTGGGARAAYQVGVLRTLARHFPEFRFDVITGVSAGAINAVFMASHPGSVAEAAKELMGIWRGIRFADVFRVDLPCLALSGLRWLLKLGVGGTGLAPTTRSLLDTEPLRGLLGRVLEVGEGGRVLGIARNLEAGRLEALSLATVNYGTGQTVNWVEGRDVRLWRRPKRKGLAAEIGIEHVMASSSLPLVFPAIELEGAWYGDGGIRLAAPLSPALHIGVERILAVSTRYDRSQEEADRASDPGYPSPLQIAGNLLNAIFLDVLDQDLARLSRMNELLGRMPASGRGRLRPVEVHVIRPSQDLGRLAGRFEPDLPRGFRFLLRGLGSKRMRSPDALSLLMFQPEYLHALIELGEQDAGRHLEHLRRLLGASEVGSPG